MITMILALVLAVPTASATEFSGAPHVNEHSRIAAELDDMRAELDALKARKAGGMSAADKARLAELDQSIAEISDLLAGMSGVDTDHTDAIAKLEATIAALEARIAALETAPAVEPGDVYQTFPVIEVRTSGFHPSVYAIGSMLVVDPVPGETDKVLGRFDFGASFLWDVPKSNGRWLAGLVVEGGPSSGGFSVRGGPSAVNTGTGLGAITAVGYNCDRLSKACGAEHTGVLFAGTWQRQLTGPLNVTARIGFETNFVTATDATPGIEWRPVGGIGLALGNVKRSTVSVGGPSDQGLDEL